MRDREDDFDELADLLSEAANRNPGFVGALEDVQARQALLDQLIQIRKSLKISQRVVAERMQTTQSAISDIENGVVDPHLSTMQRYARAVTARILLTVDLPHDSPWCEMWFYSRPKGVARIRAGEPAQPLRPSVRSWREHSSAAPVARMDESRTSFHLAR
ncbi:type II toxin-antitoxin system antitoxin HigA [Catenuloplanes niger JCM 9533]